MFPSDGRIIASLLGKKSCPVKDLQLAQKRIPSEERHKVASKADTHLGGYAAKKLLNCS